MDDDLDRTPMFNDSSEFDDLKFISRLSTILVASIQEVKDRVSQIEFVFCSQLFPGFQMTSRVLQKKIADTRKLAEDEWKEKEQALLQQVKELQTERQQFQEEVQQLNNALEQTKTRLMSAEQSVDRHELEKEVLSTRLECLMRNEDIHAKLKMQFDQEKSELSEAKKMQKKLSEEIELNNQKLLNEQAKGKDLLMELDKMTAMYKQLKSQYMFAVGKFNHKSGNECYLDRVDVVNNSPRSHLKKRRLQDSEEKEEEEVTDIASQVDESKTGSGAHENPLLHQDVDVFKRSRNDSHTNPAYLDSILPKHDVGTSKLESIACRKKSSSSWRDTRAHETRGGDPHDNFLDTPLEIARNLNKLPFEPAQDLAAPPPQDLDFHNSDDETQDMNAKTIPLEQRNSAGPANKGFRYREPVRKKAERENLEGVECIQCKKFYDAVLPGDDNNPNDKIRRCEHHDGVSRHRYRYAPPSTPEGFWNIGFDSDM
ncbi:protein gamma response 1-like [Zingiber officinale]|nr:protein gamma response 1-like [Zingiber officinale]XP_042376960.1 protein gamma response 1-like [Zingiber officinale]